MSKAIPPLPQYVFMAQGQLYFYVNPLPRKQILDAQLLRLIISSTLLINCLDFCFYALTA